MFCPIFWYLNWGVGVCHAAGTNSGTSTRLSNSLMEVYTSSSSQSSLLSSPKSPHKTINLVLVFENRKNSSCSLLCPLYLELAHICPQQPGGELLGRFGSEWVDLSRCCWVDYLAVTHPPARPRYWLRRDVQDRNRGRNLCKSISCSDTVPSFGPCFHVFLLKKSIITKWRLLGNVSREMSDVPDSHGRVKGAE